MSQQILEDVVKSQLKTDLPALHVGDTVDVHVRIIEGAKQRIQTFNGVIIKMQSQGISRSITVRRIVANEGVERTFKLHSPKVATIDIKRHGHTRRARLYYLRDRIGKKRRLRDRRRGLGNLILEAASAKKAKTDSAKAATDDSKTPAADSSAKPAPAAKDKK